jgi:type II secretory pathway pseudopilin PulG
MTVDAYSDWDAAYLLGSLSAVERREFERHLALCERCSAAVAELAGIPGLLAALPADTVSSLIDTPQPLPVPATLLPRLVRSVARRRRRSRVVVAAAIVSAAAAAAAIALAVPLLFAPASAGPGTQAGSASSARPVTSVALGQVVPGPLSADVRLVPEAWGTRLEMNCRYASSPSSAPPGYRTGVGTGYAMFVTDAAGTVAQVATWTATPGSTVEPSGTTSLAVADIRSIDVRSTVDGRVLLSGSL